MNRGRLVLLLLQLTLQANWAAGFIVLSSASSAASSSPGSAPSSSAFTRSIARALSQETVSTTVISKLAVLAIQLRLKSHDDVACIVQQPGNAQRTMNSDESVWRGHIGPVTVEGKGWESGLGLSCRSITATVDKCSLDLKRVVTHRKLRLTQLCHGRATVALSGEDLDHMLQHPVIQPPIVADNNKLKFGTGARVVASHSSGGHVEFPVVYQGDSYMCRLLRGGAQDRSRAKVQLILAQDSPLSMVTNASNLATALTRFFNELTIELDGTFLAFSDLSFSDGENEDEPNLQLSLGLKVRKFPSAGLEF